MSCNDKASISVRRNRINQVRVSLGRDVTGHTLRSQIRSGQSEAAPLVDEWEITVTDAPTGQVLLTWDTAGLPATPDMLYTDMISVGTDLTLMPIVRVIFTDGVTSNE